MEEKKTWLERIAAKVPDPVVLFILMYAVLFVATIFAGGTTFALPGIDPSTGAAAQVKRSILDMSEAANVQWIFDNAIIGNWLADGWGTDPVKRAFYRAFRDFSPLNDLGSG